MVIPSDTRHSTITHRFCLLDDDLEEKRGGNELGFGDKERACYILRKGSPSTHVDHMHSVSTLALPHRRKASLKG
jgi:hypothetical protein